MLSFWVSNPIEKLPESAAASPVWDLQVVIFRLTELQVRRTGLPFNRILLISKTSFTKYYKHLCSHQPDLILNTVYFKPFKMD